ncbi:hypothetical protein ACXZ65_37940 [Streptomyces aculeolatus]
MNDPIVLAGTIADLKALSLNLQDLMKVAVLPVMVIFFIIVTWGKTKSAAAAFVAGCAGVLIWWFVFDIEDLRNGLDEDLSDPKAAATAARVPGGDL